MVPALKKPAVFGVAEARPSRRRAPGCRDACRLAGFFLLLMAALLLRIAPAAAVAPERLISAAGVGPLQLGLRLDAVRAAAAGFTFAESLDPAGGACVEVAEDETVLMRLFAGEGDGDEDFGASVDWSAPLVAVEVLAADYRTEAGIGPHSPLGEVEQAYGPLIRIRRSEIDRREFALFANQPPNLVLRVDGGGGGSEAGLYLPGTDMTDRFRASARVDSVTVQQVP